MEEPKDQLDAAEKERAKKRITELRAIATRALSGDRLLRESGRRSKRLSRRRLVFSRRSTRSAVLSHLKRGRLQIGRRRA
jgi:hypothetical protein